MRVSTFIASPVALLALVQAALAATIESPPSLVQCQPAAITWSGAPAGQVFLSVIPGGEASAAALVSFPTQNGASGSYTWTVNLPAGTSVTLKLVDSTGATAYSSPVTVQAGSTTDCNTQPAAAGSASGSAATSIAAASSSVASVSSSASSSAASSSSSAGSASSSVSSTSAGIAASASSAVSSVASAASSAGAAVTSKAASAASAATSAASTGAASYNKAAVSAVLLGAAGVVAALMA